MCESRHTSERTRLMNLPTTAGLERLVDPRRFDLTYWLTYEILREQAAL
jgi:hypothetical protein